jgi:uncharacterized protein Yka (UPF0111/DUF47 family)
MFSLQRFLGKGDRFFDLLEASADEARQSVQTLLELLNAPHDGEHVLEKFATSRRQEKQIHEETTALLCSTFITPLEREDIEALSNSLSRIPKVIKKFAQRMSLSPSHLNVDVFAQQVKLLQQAADMLCQMVRQLRHGAQLEKIQEQNYLLHHYEGDADKLMLDLLRELYAGKYEPVQMIVMRDLHELLEKVIDRCRDAGNVIFQIVLKNS